MKKTQFGFWDFSINLKQNVLLKEKSDIDYILCSEGEDFHPKPLFNHRTSHLQSVCLPTPIILSDNGDPESIKAREFNGFNATIPHEGRQAMGCITT